MGGLQRLFLRITPIIMLICFICFGITHTFQQEGQANITYLTHETIEVTADNPLTEENEQVTIENYIFDFKSYRDNIDINILKRATTNVIDLQAYQNTLDNFNTIWENGYNPGDILLTLGNASLLIINTLILPINIILTPLRIISGILLTAFSLIGININRQTPIINTLNAILDKATINMINPTFNKELYQDLANTRWYFKQQLTADSVRDENEYPYNLQVYFTTPGGGNYKNIRTRVEVINNVLHIYVIYTDTDNNEIYVYDNGWIYEDSRTTYFTNQNTQGRLEKAYILGYITKNATFIQ